MEERATVLLILMVVLSAKADYKFEFQLLTYTNPRGLDNDLMCCEPEATSMGNCLPQETCDTQFNIYLQNFHQLTQLGSNIVLGTYNNMDTITFPSCGPIQDLQNPLVVTFPRSAFTVGESLRLFFNIVDEDIDPITNSRRTVRIENIFAEMSRVQGINPVISSVQTLGGGIIEDLMLTFQYRLICTDGFCGNDCSQTTNCPDFAPLCPSEPSQCSAEMGCLNSGTCQDGICVSTTTTNTSPPQMTTPATSAAADTSDTNTAANISDPLSTTTFTVKMETSTVTAASQGLFVSKMMTMMLILSMLLML